jgi:hypothetical protein
MMQSQNVANDWLKEKQPGMINCPHQPGRLVISKNACMSRHMISQQEQFKIIRNREDLFHYTVKMGLAKCRECPIGEQLSVCNQ